MGIRGGVGKLNFLMTVQGATTTVDSEGGPVISYADRGEIWAAIVPIKDSERIEAQHVKGFTTHHIRTHYNADLKRTDRLVYKTRKFDVENVLNFNEADVETVCVCVEAD